MRTLLGSLLATALLLPACQSPSASQLPTVVGELHPIAQMVSDEIGGTGAFGLLVTCEVHAGQNEAFERAFLPAIAATWTEPGNRAYELARASDSSSTYVLYERWRSVEDLDWHLKSRPIVEVMAATAGMGDAEVTVLAPLVRP